MFGRFSSWWLVCFCLRIPLDSSIGQNKSREKLWKFAKLKLIVNEKLSATLIYILDSPPPTSVLVWHDNLLLLPFDIRKIPNSIRREFERPLKVNASPGKDTWTEEISFSSDFFLNHTKVFSEFLQVFSRSSSSMRQDEKNLENLAKKLFPTCK